MRYAVLGPLEVCNGAGPVPVGGRKERALLAVLLAAPGGWAAADRLTELLWDEPPPSAGRTLQAYVSRLRHVLEPSRNGAGPQVLRTVPGGWQLSVVDDEVDSRRFEALADQARVSLRAGRYADAGRLADEALRQWRSDAFGGYLHIDVCAAEAARLTELRAAAEHHAVDAALALGGADELVGRLERAVQQDPLRERSWQQLIVALHRSGRPADALAAYQRARRGLREELGVEPSESLRRVQAEVLRLQLPPPAPVETSDSTGPPRNPFKGLLPYAAQDAGLLFGREHLLTRLLARLETATTVCLVGASGGGKTSLVQAGLLPALQRGALPGSTGWRCIAVTPTGALDGGLPPPGSVDLLVVDQLEEITTLGQDAARTDAFVAQLLALAARGVRLVLAVRSDLWADCADLDGLGNLITDSSVLVGPLTEPEVVAVIREGARRGGLAGAEDALVDAVLEDARGRPGMLPLLSTALVRTWERRRNNLLTLDGYRAAGGLVGAVGESADEVWASLAAAERLAARRILMRLAGD